MEIDTDNLAALVPLAGTLGVRVTHASHDEVRGEFDHRDELCTAGGVLHGGALMAFADTLGATLAVHHLPEGALTTTIESKTNFFRAVTEGTVSAVTKPLHVGRSTIVVQTDITRSDGKPVAQTTQTQAVLGADANLPHGSRRS